MESQNCLLGKDPITLEISGHLNKIDRVGSKTRILEQTRCMYNIELALYEIDRGKRGPVLQKINHLFLVSSLNLCASLHIEKHNFRQCSFHLKTSCLK